MATAQKKKMNQNIILVVISIAIIAIIYFIISIVRLFQKPVDTVMIKKGELINYEEVVGYVIRDEEIVDNSSYEGTIKSGIPDATRVAKESTIVTYVSKSEQQILDKIAKLDEKIDKAIESKSKVLPSDVKGLEAEIESSIYTNIKENKNLNAVKEYKKYLSEKIEKKAKIVGELSPAGSEIKNLMSQRTEYEKELNNAEKNLIAPVAGLVSYRVDNFENVLTYAGISKLSSKDLANMKISIDQMIPMNMNTIKLVNNFECYLAIPMKSLEAQKANLNDTIYLRFKNTGDSLIPATIDYISKEEDGVLLILKVKSNIEELTKYRKVGLDVVWWSDTGLKISKDALFETEMKTEIEKYNMIESGEEMISGDTYMESGTIKLPTLTVTKSYSNYDVYVKILRETEDFAIVDNYTDSELYDMGMNEEMINNRMTIKMYDECMIHNVT